MVVCGRMKVNGDIMNGELVSKIPTSPGEFTTAKRRQTGFLSVRYIEDQERREKAHTSPAVCLSGLIWLSSSIFNIFLEIESPLPVCAQAEE